MEKQWEGEEFLCAVRNDATVPCGRAACAVFVVVTSDATAVPGLQEENYDPDANVPIRIAGTDNEMMINTRALWRKASASPELTLLLNEDPSGVFYVQNPSRNLVTSLTHSNTVVA